MSEWPLLVRGLLGESFGETCVRLMKLTDISQTALVRRYGIRGAKLFARLWFPLLYVVLVALTAALWVVGADLVAGWRRIAFGALIAIFAVVAASLLTRMRLEYYAAIEGLETRGQSA